MASIFRKVLLVLCLVLFGFEIFLNLDYSYFAGDYSGVHPEHASITYGINLVFDMIIRIIAIVMLILMVIYFFERRKKITLISIILLIITIALTFLPNN